MRSKHEFMHQEASAPVSVEVSIAHKTYIFIALCTLLAKSLLIIQDSLTWRDAVNGTDFQSKVFSCCWEELVYSNMTPLVYSKLLWVDC